MNPIPQLREGDRARFWSKVKKGPKNRCWNWIASTDGRYGKFYMKINPDASTYRRQNRTEIKAHRMAYFLTHGVDPEELDVCHECDNPRCCNPAHLFLGTRSENLIDMVKKGRNRPISLKGENNGNAKLSGDQITEIREMYAQGGSTQRALAFRFNVARSLICRIVKGIAWPHLATVPLEFTSRKGMQKKSVICC